MNIEQLQTNRYLLLTDAVGYAQTASNQTKQTYKVIKVHGIGYRVVPETWDTNRLYYHGQEGRKMYFDLIDIIQPKI